MIKGTFLDKNVVGCYLLVSSQYITALVCFFLKRISLVKSVLLAAADEVIPQMLYHVLAEIATVCWRQWHAAAVGQENGGGDDG